MIPDPVTKEVKRVKAYVVPVVSEDGVKVEKVFSTLAEGLAGKLELLHQTGELYNRMIQIVWWPQGFATKYQVQVI